MRWIIDGVDDLNRVVKEYRKQHDICSIRADGGGKDHFRESGSGVFGDRG